MKKCPKCKTTLQVTDKSCVEIDYCPFCKGLWLEKGELERIIDRTASTRLNNSGVRLDDGSQNFKDKYYY